MDGCVVTVSTEGNTARELRLPAFADVCEDCGMVTLFIRVAEARAR